MVMATSMLNLHRVSAVDAHGVMAGLIMSIDMVCSTSAGASGVVARAKAKTGGTVSTAYAYVDSSSASDTIFSLTNGVATVTFTVPNGTTGIQTCALSAALTVTAGQTLTLTCTAPALNGAQVREVALQ